MQNYASFCKGARQMGEIYAQFFPYICFYFFNAPTGQAPLRDFYAQYVKQRASAQGSVFLGLEN